MMDDRDWSVAKMMMLTLRRLEFYKRSDIGPYGVRADSEEELRRIYGLWHSGTERLS